MKVKGEPEGTCATEGCGGSGEWLVTGCGARDGEIWNVLLCPFHCEDVRRMVGEGLPASVEVGPRGAVLLAEES